MAIDHHCVFHTIAPDTSRIVTFVNKIIYWYTKSSHTTEAKRRWNTWICNKTYSISLRVTSPLIKLITDLMTERKSMFRVLEMSKKELASTAIEHPLVERKMGGSFVASCKVTIPVISNNYCFSFWELKY